MTKEILNLSDKRRTLNKIRKGDPLAMQNYSEVNQEIGRRIKEKALAVGSLRSCQGPNYNRK